MVVGPESDHGHGTSKAGRAVREPPSPRTPVDGVVNSGNGPAGGIYPRGVSVGWAMDTDDTPTGHDTGHHDDDHTGHHQGTHGLGGMAASATLHCLTGCAIGEIAGLVIGAAVGLGNGATIALSVALAFGFGFALSSLPLLRVGLAVGAALGLVAAADTLSIATMEVVDNVVVALVPGAMDAGLSDPVFWLSMAAALVAAFVAAYPVNRWLLRRGKGHALTHGFHGAGGEVTGWRRHLPSPSTRALALGLATFLASGLVLSLAV